MAIEYFLSSETKLSANVQGSHPRDMMLLDVVSFPEIYRDYTVDERTVKYDDIFYIGSTPSTMVSATLGDMLQHLSVYTDSSIDHSDDYDSRLTYDMLSSPEYSATANLVDNNGNPIDVDLHKLVVPERMLSTTFLSSVGNYISSVEFRPTHNGCTIGPSAFNYFNCISSLYIPPTISQIADGAFDSCGQLKTIYVSDNCTVAESPVIKAYSEYQDPSISIDFTPSSDNPTDNTEMLYFLT